MKAAKSNTNGQRESGTPGQVLQKFFMDPLRLTAYRVAKDIGITQIAMSHILRGRRAITTTVALRLGVYFGVEPEFWMSLQAHRDLAAEAGRKKHLPIERCSALAGRSFALKETKLNGIRNWQILMVKARTNGNGKR